MDIFRIMGQDNMSYAFRRAPQLTKYQRIHQEILPQMDGEPLADFARCKVCGQLIDKWDHSFKDLVLKKRNYDISCTYDGVDVVSARFKAICEENNLAGLVFQLLPSDPSFFSIRATKVVSFDAQRRKTRFLNQCTSCGQFKTVVGATPVFLTAGSQVGAAEFARTDLEFASGDEKHPLLLCGETAHTILSKYNLRGLEFAKVMPSGQSEGQSKVSGTNSDANTSGDKPNAP